MEKTSPLQDLVQEIYSFLAGRFPVCCWSDEFVFFPQALEKITDWSRWDDFSPDSVDETVTVLGGIIDRIKLLGDRELDGATDPGPVTRLMDWVLLTLQEQLREVRAHATQPTFVLTVASMGIVQAVQSGDQAALEARLRNLPGFLERAGRSLAQVPGIFLELGQQMVGDLVQWLKLVGPESQTGQCLEALANFSRKLSGMGTVEDFRLAPDLFEKVVWNHTGSGLDPGEALLELKEEAEIAGGLLAEEARKLGCSGDWRSFLESIPGDPIPEGGKRRLLGREIKKLRDHCFFKGFIPHQAPGLEELSVGPVPPALSSIRAADSYNARPGSPFQGGDFHIFEGGSLGEAAASVHPVFRMTVAHEAFPGHHLLDCFRWNNLDPALRPVEYPLYYEGWACFGEDLMLHTGAFDRAYDRAILLGRHFTHAVRGKVDLELHMGALGLEDAARELAEAGFSRERAKDTVRKYALRPAYQMCYTVGRRKFQRLFEIFGEGDVARFVTVVLTSGELLFEDLEKVLEKTPGRAKR